MNPDTDEWYAMWYLSHNQWARILRMIAALFLGKDVSKWPPFLDNTIYDLSERLVEFYMKDQNEPR
jgi:hypothetical protein